MQKSLILITFVHLLLPLKSAADQSVNNGEDEITKLQIPEKSNRERYAHKPKRSISDNDETVWANRGRINLYNVVPKQYKENDLLNILNPVSVRDDKISDFLNLYKVNQRSIKGQNNKDEADLPMWPSRGRRQTDMNELLARKYLNPWRSNILFYEKQDRSDCAIDRRKGCEVSSIRTDDGNEDEGDIFLSNRDQITDETDPFWGNRGRRYDVSDKFWGNRGRRDDEKDPFWGNRGRRDEEIDPFWGNRGRRDEEVNPFWGNRGRRDDENNPFWGNRGRRYNDDNPFWGNKERRNDYTWGDESKRIEKIFPFWGIEGRETNGNRKFYSDKYGQKFKQKNRGNRNNNKFASKILRGQPLFVEEPEYIFLQDDFDRESRSSERDPFFISRGKKTNAIEHRTRRGLIDQLNKELNADPFFVTRGKRSTNNYPTEETFSNLNNSNKGNNIKRSNINNNKYGLLLPTPGKKMLLSNLLKALASNRRINSYNTYSSNTRGRRALLDKLSLSNDPYFVTRGKKSLNTPSDEIEQGSSKYRRNILSKLSGDISGDPFFVTRGKKNNSILDDDKNNEILKEISMLNNDDYIRNIIYELVRENTISNDDNDSEN